MDGSVEWLSLVIRFALIVIAGLILLVASFLLLRRSLRASTAAGCCALEAHASEGQPGTGREGHRRGAATDTATIATTATTAESAP